MMLESPQAQALLGEVVSALNSDPFGEKLCSWLNLCVRYDNLTVIAYYQDRPPSALVLSSRERKVHENFERVYVNGAYLLDPFHALHTKKAPKGVYRLSDISPDQFRRNRYFLEYYQNTTMVDEVGFIAYPSDGVSVHVCLGRAAASNQKFSTRDLTAARTIAPVVCALVERHWAGLNSTGRFDENTIVSQLITQAKARHQIALSPRQAQVAMLILRGHSSISIGLQLSISPQTVKVFRKQLYKKCQISSQAELFNLMLPLLTPEA